MSAGNGFFAIAEAIGAREGVDAALIARNDNRGGWARLRALRDELRARGLEQGWPVDFVAAFTDCAPLTVRRAAERHRARIGSKNERKQK